MSEILYRPHRHDDHMEKPTSSNVGAIGVCDCGSYVRCAPVTVAGKFFGYRWFTLNDKAIRKARKVGHLPEVAA